MEDKLRESAHKFEGDDEKNISASLRQSNKRVQDLLSGFSARKDLFYMLADSCYGVVAITDLEGKLAYLNPAGLVYFGVESLASLKENQGGESIIQGFQTAAQTIRESVTINGLGKAYAFPGHSLSQGKSILNASVYLHRDSEGNPSELVFLFLGTGGDGKSSLLSAGITTSEQGFEDESPDLLTRCQLDTTLIYVNQAYAQYLGMSVEELVGKSFLETIPEEDRDLILEDFSNLGKDFPIGSRINRNYLENGKVGWQQWINRAVLGENGEVVEVRCTGHDITDLVQTREELQKTRQEFSKLMASLPDALCSGLVEDGTTLLTYISPVIEKIIGYTPAEALADPAFWETIVYPEDFPKLAAFWESINQGGLGLWEIEYRIVHKDGTLRWIRDRQISKQVENNIIRFDSVITDITEQKNILAALEVSESQYKLLTDSMTDIIALFDLEGKLLYISPSGKRSLGWEVGENYGDAWGRLVKLDDEEIVFSNIHELLDKKKDVLFEWRCHLDGQPLVWMETIAHLILDESRKPYRWITTTRDITDRKHVEQELQGVNEQLLEYVDQLGRSNRVSNALNEMGDLFQSCRAEYELFKVVSQYAPSVFQGVTGAVYILNKETRLFEIAAKWGDDFSGKHRFAADDCWALRRCHAYYAENKHPSLRCRHLDEEHRQSGEPYICIPMIAQGEAIGVLHLQNLSDFSGHALIRMKQGALNVGKQIAMALTNLRLRETLRLQSICDPLTGLYNRRYMDVSLRRELNRAMRQRSTIGIGMMDIDRFKRFNDEMGHDAGDVLLKALGNYLVNHIRGSDIACRYGGEEFVLIFPDTNLKTAGERIEQIRLGLKGMQVSHRGRILMPISVSIGVASYPNHGTTPEELLKSADIALFKAKARGRDQIVIGQQ